MSIFTFDSFGAFCWYCFCTFTSVETCRAFVCNRVYFYCSIATFTPVRLVSTSYSTTNWSNCDIQQLYPDVLRYELAVEGRNHKIHLEKNRFLNTKCSFLQFVFQISFTNMCFNIQINEKKVSVIAAPPVFYRNLIGGDFTETQYSEDGQRVTTKPNEVRSVNLRQVSTPAVLFLFRCRKIFNTVV